AHIPATRAAVEELFTALEPPPAPGSAYSRRERYRTATELLGTGLDRLETVLGHCTFIARALHRHAERLATPQAAPAALELSAELEQQSMKWEVLGQELFDLCE